MEWRTDNDDDDVDDGIHVPSLNLIYKFMLVNFAENRIAIAMKIQRDGSNRPTWSFQCAMLAIEPPANLKLSTRKCNTIRVWIDINRNLLSNGKPFFWLCIRCSQARIVIICTLLRYFVRASCLRHKRRFSSYSLCRCVWHVFLFHYKWLLWSQISLSSDFRACLCVSHCLCMRMFNWFLWWAIFHCH